jgi:antitoxin component YwqK of YwqJK toxin-antitoxin module
MSTRASFSCIGKLTKTLTILILLLPAITFAEVTRESIVNTDGTVELVFYIKGKKIARQVWSHDGEGVKTTGIIPNGTVKHYCGYGAIWEITYKNNLAEGISKMYDKKGKLRFKSQYKKGKLNDVSKVYYSDGKLMREMKYQKGRLVTSKEYEKNGTLIFEQFFP